MHAHPPTRTHAHTRAQTQGWVGWLRAGWPWEDYTNNEALAQARGVALSSYLQASA